jgi:hypothetical protein
MSVDILRLGRSWRIRDYPNCRFGSPPFDGSSIHFNTAKVEKLGSESEPSPPETKAAIRRTALETSQSANGPKAGLRAVSGPLSL